MVEDCLVAEQLCGLDYAGVLQLCNSLGERCDLGFIQRFMGVETLDMLRFAGCPPDVVLRLLQSEFEGFPRPGDMYLDIEGPNREFMLRSRSVDIQIHTFENVATSQAATVLANHVRKLKVLKAQLIRDLTSGKRLFVLLADDPDKNMHELAAAIRSYGANSLLWLVLADASHPAGSVEQLAPGLLRGYLTRRGRYTNGPSIPGADWLAVCGAAVRLWRADLVPTAAAVNHIQPGSANPMPQISGRTDAPVRGQVFTHWIEGPEHYSVATMQAAVPADGSYVFSAWVRVPHDFRGTRIGLRIVGAAPEGRFGAAIPVRGEWQFIWAVAHITGPAVTCQLIAAAQSGDSFCTAGWCLEPGTRPTAQGFAYAAPVRDLTMDA